MNSSKLTSKMDFSGHNIYVGMDVHKKNWNISIYVDDVFYKSFQQAPNAGQLETYLKENFSGASYRCAYEAGFCGFWIQRELSHRGISCIVVNPADIPSKDKDRKRKTDKLDSKRIAYNLGARQLEPIYIPSKIIEGDRRLVRFRKAVQRDLNRSRGRIQSELHLLGIDIPEQYSGWSKAFVNWLKALDLNEPSLRYTLDQEIHRAEQLRQQLLELNRALRTLIKETRYAEIGALLQKITGLGFITTITLLTELAEIHRFETFDHLNSFVGFCPTEHSTGDDEQKGKITPRGHRLLRSYLIEASWMAIRNDPAMAAAYSSYTKRMTGKRAITRIARKLLNRIYTTWKQRRPYKTGIN